MGIVFVFVSELLASVLDLRSRFSNKTILALEEKLLLLESHHWKASWGKVECHPHHPYHPHHPHHPLHLRSPPPPPPTHHHYCNNYHHHQDLYDPHLSPFNSSS